MKTALPALAGQCHIAVAAEKKINNFSASHIVVHRDFDIQSLIDKYDSSPIYKFYRPWDL